MNQFASTLLPRGVNSPVRSHKAVGGVPLWVSRGSGPYLWDTSDKKYIDYVGGYGPAILGHAHPVVVERLQAVLSEGCVYGASHEQEYHLAQCIIQCMPHLEMLRFMNSGTEACMTAIRLARGVTGRNKIVKCIGCYHGHSDGLLVESGSGCATLACPSSAGVPNTSVEDTMLVPYNDLSALEDLFSQHGASIAAVILEPICGNMSMILPKEGYLKTLRILCDRYGILLIFDEVMTGFRVSLGGAQAVYNVNADITVLGKVIGGGLPIGAVGASREIMSYLAPLGKVYQAGTFSGNRMSVEAGLATLEFILNESQFYPSLSARSKRLMDAISCVFEQKGIAHQLQCMGGMLGLCFSAKPLSCYEDVQASDDHLFRAFFHHLLQRGIYWPPSKYEAAFLSWQHSDAILSETIEHIRAWI